MKGWIRFGAMLGLTCGLFAHDMWLEAESFFVEPGRKVTIRGGNGTIYRVSDNAVTPDRISRWIHLGPGGEALDPGPPQVEGHWLMWTFSPPTEGNYWVAVATEPRRIELPAKDFNAYLEHDGIPLVLEERRRKGILDRDEVEVYSKSVKAYLQAGASQSANFDQALGLPIEIVPEANPYGLELGDSLTVRVLFRGEPLPRFLLHGGYEDSDQEVVQLYSDDRGRVTIPITSAGRWYLRGIHLFEVADREHTYESYWASLTFEVKRPKAKGP
jgi:hypothetical protein